MSNNKTLMWVSVLLGVIFIGIAFFYWTTSAGSLPSFVPGFKAGDTAVHFKHGLAAAILAALLFVFAWFQSAPKKSVESASPQQ